MPSYYPYAESLLEIYPMPGARDHLSFTRRTKYMPFSDRRESRNFPGIASLFPIPRSHSPGPRVSPIYVDSSVSFLGSVSHCPSKSARTYTSFRRARSMHGYAKLLQVD